MTRAESPKSLLERRIRYMASSTTGQSRAGSSPSAKATPWGPRREEVPAHEHALVDPRHRKFRGVLGGLQETVPPTPQTRRHLGPKRGLVCRLCRPLEPGPREERLVQQESLTTAGDGAYRSLLQGTPKPLPLFYGTPGREDRQPDVEALRNDGGHRPARRVGQGIVHGEILGPVLLQQSQKAARHEL